jgi:hypothetical protein
VRSAPRGGLSSTEYVLANLGEEYLVLQPSEANAAFTVTLQVGSYAVECLNITSRETLRADTVTVERDEAVTFTAPFQVAGSTVPYLRKGAHWRTAELQCSELVLRTKRHRVGSSRTTDEPTGDDRIVPN